MEADGRRTRGFVALELVRALRRETAASVDLPHADRQLIADGLEPAGWVAQAQLLRLAAAARERLCEGDWSAFHELGAASLGQILELGYRSIVRVGDPETTFAALTVLWRASFNYGRAEADTDAWGATIYVIGCPGVSELEGNLHAGWCLGVARLIETDCAQLELRRRPWVDAGDEQVVRLQWRERGPTRRPTPHPRAHAQLAKPGPQALG